MLVKTDRGFTVVEIMVIIVIMTLTTAVAIPGYQAFIKNNEASQVASRLASALYLARSEAIQRGVPITVCAMPANSSGSSGVCQRTATTWDAWVVFEDPTGVGLDTPSTTIKYYEGAQRHDITRIDTPSAITYLPSGFAQSGTDNKRFTIQPGCTTGTQYAREVLIKLGGAVVINKIACN